MHFSRAVHLHITLVKLSNCWVERSQTNSTGLLTCKPPILLQANPYLIVNWVETQLTYQVRMTIEEFMCLPCTVIQSMLNRNSGWFMCDAVLTMTLSTRLLTKLCVCAKDAHFKHNIVCSLAMTVYELFCVTGLLT